MAVILSFLFLFSSVARASSPLWEEARKHFEPLPTEPAGSATAPQVELGRKLFFDPRFSSDGTVSCLKCHQPGLYGTDGLAKSLGVGSKPNARNAPTLLNIGFNTQFHWHGDRASLEEQIGKSFTGANFGNADAAAVLARIKKIPGYEAEFKGAFPDEAEAVSYPHVQLAIASFERSLVSRAPFDRYLEGDESALGTEAKNGLKTFMDVGCVKCHDGATVGGQKLRKFGVFGEYWKLTGSNPIDVGRFEATQDENDRYRFKVPSLRNIARSAPYFHDGSVPGLAQAVTIMAKLQLDLELTPEQVSNVLAFLDALTGEIPGHYLTSPILPAGAFAP